LSSFKLQLASESVVRAERLCVRHDSGAETRSSQMIAARASEMRPVRTDSGFQGSCPVFVATSATHRHVV